MLGGIAPSHDAHKRMPVWKSRFGRHTSVPAKPVARNGLQSDLADHGIRVGVDRIKRIRKKLGLRCKQKRKFKVTTDSKHNLPIGTQPAGTELHRGSAEPGMGERYHLHSHRRRLAVPGGPEGLVQWRTGRLRHERADDEEPGHAGAIPGAFPPSAPPRG